MKPIPEIGKTCKFYDGKLSRQYDALVLDVITKEDIKKEMLSTHYNEESAGEISLYDKWVEESSYKDLIFAEDTDYFIECDIPDYDEYHIWFARTKEGGWFSTDIQSGW